MEYNEIDSRKKAFIFELDDVLYPEKDYLYQVYYLFANLLEYTELLDSKVLIDVMTAAYQASGHNNVFDSLKTKANVNEKFRPNFERLTVTAKLPLRLLMYQNMVNLLQAIVIDRKKLFIVTNGDPQRQLNKIKQVDWLGLEEYLVCYFANETAPKPEPDVLHLLMNEHNLQRRDLVMVGKSESDMRCAETCGIDYYYADMFL